MHLNFRSQSDLIYIAFHHSRSYCEKRKCESDGRGAKAKRGRGQSSQLEGVDAENLSQGYLIGFWRDEGVTDRGIFPEQAPSFPGILCII